MSFRQDSARNRRGGGRDMNGRDFNRKITKPSSMMRLPAGSQLKSPNWNAIQLPPITKNIYKEHPSVASQPKAHIAEYFKANNVIVKGVDIPNPVMSFANCNLPVPFLKKCYEMKYEAPTPIQAVGWPIALTGRNMVGIARTGSGKTLSFALPGILHILQNKKFDKPNCPTAAVICPTRELAIQVAEVAQQFAQLFNLRCVVAYGGSGNRNAQTEEIRKGVDLIVATPGRLLDFMETDLVCLENCSYLVFDEADRMLDMGFEDQVRNIFVHVRPDAQILMWSATWPKAIRSLASTYLKNYVHVTVGSDELTANHNIRQIIEVVDSDEKELKLGEILGQLMKQPNHKTLIFVQTKRYAESLTQRLKGAGWPVMAIHGDKNQAEREQVLQAFRDGTQPVVIATDLASRGLDVSDISYVINVDMPKGLESYIHRIGRTGRSNNVGTAFSLVTSEDKSLIPELIRVLHEANQPVPQSLINLTQHRPTTNIMPSHRNMIQPNNAYQRNSMCFSSGPAPNNPNLRHPGNQMYSFASPNQQLPIVRQPQFMQPAPNMQCGGYPGFPRPQSVGAPYRMPYPNQ